jgi:hypothetical protein
MPDVLPTFLHPDAWALAFGGAWLFLIGLLVQLFSRWGLAVQAIAIVLFIPLLVTWPLNAGPGFVLGCVSTATVALGYGMRPARDGRDRGTVRKNRLGVLGVVIVLVAALFPGLIIQTSTPGPYSQDPVIAEMLQQVDENNIHGTIGDLQNLTTRYYGTSGNMEASKYLYDRLSSISGLSVEYQGRLRNVVATLPGSDAAAVYMVGAHYDSESDDLNYAPGATDNGGGVAIVLELARVMSQYTFVHTIKFALWNAEEGGADIGGSQEYVRHAVAEHENIALYMNFDSSCYDPDDRLVLDIMHNDRSKWVSDMMAQNNRLYGIGFNLTYQVFNAHGSDHRSFWGAGYPAVMTHSERHGPAQTVNDTADKVSMPYAKKNGQLCMSVIASLAGLERPI